MASKATLEDDVLRIDRWVRSLGRNGPKKRYSILLVSDYFFPNLGGVEMHMF